MTILKINSGLDRHSLAIQFDEKGYVQISDVLTHESALELKRIFALETPWSLVSQVGAMGPLKSIRAEDLGRLRDDGVAIINREVQQAENTKYAFIYYSYPLVTAYLERWRPGSMHEQLLEELNSSEFLDLLRDISRVDNVVKADGQATLYAPGHFLWPHTDAETSRGREIAYVLNLTDADWRPEWGGYLNFYDANMDIERAFRPKFNTMNLLKVPRWHSVSEVTSSAPSARYAVTGWARTDGAIK